MIEIGDIIQIVDGSWSVVSTGEKMWGVDLPSEALVVAIDSSHRFPTGDNNVLPYHKRNNVKVSYGDKLIYTRDDRCVVLYKFNSIELRKMKLEKLQSIQ